MGLVLEFSVILVAFLVAVSIVLDSIRVGITPMPSSALAREAIVNILDKCEGKRIVELGSGWGNRVNLDIHHSEG